MDPNNAAPQPQRSENKGRLLIGVGLMLFLAGSIGLILIQYGSVFGVSRPANPIVFYIAAFLSVAVSIRLFVRGNKLRTRDALELVAEKERSGDDTRPTFLYLRSFQLDTKDARHSIPMPGGLSAPVNPWESGLTGALNKVGDVVAIGRPGEKLATVGASRFYPTHEEWHDKITELIGKSDLVFWTYGETEGLLWEISKLEKVIEPEKLIMAFPFWDKSVKKRRRMWTEITEKMSDRFSKPLPDKIEGHSLFIGFDKDWNAQWFESPKPNWPARIACLGFWSPIAKGIQSVLTKRGYNYPPLTTGERWLYGFFALLGWILVSVILVMIYGLFVAFSR